MRHVLAVSLMLFAPAAVRAGEAPAAPSPEALVQQLGDAGFEVREKAQQQLATLGVDAKAALEAAEKSGDAEIRERTRRLLVPIRSEEARAADRAWINANLAPVFGAKQLLPPNASGATAHDDTTDNGCNSEDTFAWLTHAQSEDGRWDSRKFGADVDADIEQTSFALLAFLGAGHTEKVGTYKQNVKAAVAWLSKQMRADGAFFRNGEIVDGVTQAVGTLALCEAAGMGNLKETKEAAQKAVACCTDTFQTTKGGERLGFGKRPNSEIPDLFTTTFFVMALKSAKVAALNVRPEAFDGIIQFLDSLDDKRLKAFRLAPEQKTSCRATILGCLCRQFLGYKKDDLEPYVAPAFAQYGEPGKPSGNIVTDYLATLVALQQGGDIWRNYDTPLIENLRDQQEKQGKERGSWTANGECSGAGSVFVTSLAAICLNIYCRWPALR